MFPHFTSIDRNIYANIMSSGKGLNAFGNTVVASSELMPFVRIISGTGDGLILYSNPNIPNIAEDATPTKDANGNIISVKSSPSLYGNRYNSGMLGLNWNMEPVFPFNTPFTGDLVLRPSPVVTDLEIKEGKDQISRTAKIVIKCFSLSQVEKLQEYLMEPGHSLFIEYGWNTDRAEMQMIQLLDSKNNNAPYSSDFISISIASANLNAGNLQEKRIKSLGDYDSFFGFIVGGTMTSESDTYILTIDLRGMPGLPSYLQLHENINTIEETKDSQGKVISRKVSNLPEAPLYNSNEINNSEYTLQSVGERRWKWMFNKLPATRQTFEVQKLINNIKNSTDSPNGWWDLINFDYLINEQIVEFGNDTWWDNIKRTIGLEPEFQKDGVKIPKERLVTENRYIRFSKVIEILNRNNGLFSYKIGNKEVKVRIQPQNFIGAFPKIFSTKPSKLIIPGKLPDFQSYYLNTSQVETSAIIDSEIDNSINVSYAKSIGPVVSTGFVNTAPWTAGYQTAFQSSMQQQNSATSIVTEKISFVQYSSDGKGLRPAAVDPKDASKGNYLGYYEKDGYYGELGNLYINFGIFIDALKNSSNKSIREVLMDMLNEMSSAVNSFWNFQLVEGTDKNGDYVLRIIDENWSGRNEATVRNFVHAGEKSVFLDASLSVDIPSEMTNQIILKRQDYISNPNSKNISIGGIFTQKTDKFFKGVDYLKNIATGGTKDGKKPTKTVMAEDLRAEIEAMISTAETKSTYYLGASVIKYSDPKTKEEFAQQTVSQGSVINQAARNISGAAQPYEEYQPTTTALGSRFKKLVEEYRVLVKEEESSKNTNLNANLAKIEVLPNPESFSIDTNAFKIDESGPTAFRQNFRIYCCDDTQLFDIIKNNAFEKYGLEEIKATSHPLPIKYSFKILGRSGIRRGDTFNVYGIPKKYRDYGFFQVTEIEHTFTDNKWTTEVTGQFRQQKQ